MNKQRAFKLLKEMAFSRVGGSAEELTCANLLLKRIAELGGQATLEEFDVNTQTFSRETLLIDGQEVECVGYGNSGSTPAEGLTAPLHYCEFFTDNAVDKLKAQGKIVLTNGYLGYAAYKSLVDFGAVGFITYCGDVLDKRAEWQIMPRELRQPLKELKVLAGVNIRARDAMNIVKNCGKTATICLTQEESQTKSRNVVARIEGEIDETIVFTAHYDSVHFSKGVYDNGAGSVILMELYDYFLRNKPRRNLVFIWCGSEERGLLGSHAFVKAHEQELDKYVLCINVDVGAAILGQESAVIMAEESLAHYVDYVAKQIGHSLIVRSDIYSSDSIPFTDKGVPAINFMRFGVSGTAHIHDKRDTMEFLSADALYKTGYFAEIFAKQMVQAFAFPVPRKIPDDIKKKVDKYLNKEDKQPK